MIARRAEGHESRRDPVGSDFVVGAVGVRPLDFSFRRLDRSSTMGAATGNRLSADCP
jgi:hypothetical protein